MRVAALTMCDNSVYHASHTYAAFAAPKTSARAAARAVNREARFEKGEPGSSRRAGSGLANAMGPSATDGKTVCDA